MTGLNTLAKVLSDEELLTKEFFLEDALDSGLEPGLDPGGVGVGKTLIAPGIISGLIVFVSHASASKACFK